MGGQQAGWSQKPFTMTALGEEKRKEFFKKYIKRIFLIDQQLSESSWNTNLLSSFESTINQLLNMVKTIDRMSNSPSVDQSLQTKLIEEYEKFMICMREFTEKVYDPVTG